MTTRIILGDCRQVLMSLADGSVHCCVTSPPYFGLRDYGIAEQIGLESTPEAFVAELLAVFREVRRVLRDDGTLWVNIGDSYAGGNTTGAWREGSARADGDVRGDGATSRRNRNGIGAVSGCKPKDLIGIPWLLAFALRADGWYLRQDIIWSKPNPMPESVTDRCTKAHEYVFLLSKSERYYFDSEAMQEPAVWAPSKQSKEVERAPGYYGGKGTDASRNDQNFKAIRETRNRRSVWTIAARPYKESHFATMAPDLAETCIKAGCPIGGVVLDPFGGAGTTGLVSDQLQRDSILIELNPDYVGIAERRITGDSPLFSDTQVSQ